MTPGLPLFVLLVASVAGCARRAKPIANCEWPQDIPRSIDLSQPSQERHLNEDAEFAEDLAIRYADARRGPQSGHFEGMAEYVRTREECMAKLFQTIGATHGVTAEQVRQSLGRRRTELDLAVILSFAGLYAWAAYGIARRIFETHADGSLARIAMVMYASVAASGVGVFLGELWSTIMESIRLGTGHMSYRGTRVPWSHHRLGLFFGGVLLFWLAAALRHRAASSQR
jgi:hypothetical protein